MVAKRQRPKGTFDALAALDVLASEHAKEHHGPEPAERDDKQLFVLDSAPFEGQGGNVGVRKRKRASKEKKTTRAAAIIAASCRSQPMVPWACLPWKKGASVRKSAEIMELRQVQTRALEAEGGPLHDVWQDESKDKGWNPARPKPNVPSRMRTPNRPAIAAVQVDRPGCSYNPDGAAHQEAVAEAVATEVNAEIAAALRPPHLQPGQLRESHSELVQGLFSDDEEGNSTCAGAEESARHPAGCALRMQRKRSVKDAAKAARRRAAEEESRSKRALKAMRRDIDSAKRLEAELAEDAAAKALALQRREADREAWETELPPRLGRHRFSPAKVQVLTSDEVSGSLRKLKTLPQVATDRFKSLQQRGIVQVTVPQHYTKPTKRRAKVLHKKG